MLFRRRKKRNTPAIKARNASGIVTPIAALAPLDNDTPAADPVEFDDFPVAVGPKLEPVPDVELAVGVAGTSVSSSDSRDKISKSVFCQRTGIASHNAEVSLGTTHAVKAFCEGMLIGTLGVGFGAGQTLVKV
jgi:hypothetical protein